MSEAKPTPGPWFADGYKVWAGEERGYKVADTAYHAEPGFDEQRANAYLIAAAPELLHAAKMAQETIGWITDASKERYVKETLQKAIEKAKGSA